MQLKRKTRECYVTVVLISTGVYKSVQIHDWQTALSQSSPQNEVRKEDKCRRRLKIYFLQESCKIILQANAFFLQYLVR